MEYSPAQIINKLLIDAGIGGEFTTEFSATDFNTAWPSFVSAMPDKPDDCVCVIDTGSNKDGRLLRTGKVIEHPTCQIQIRSRTYQYGWGKGILIQNAIDSVSKSSVVMDVDTTIRIHSITRAQSLLAIGMEPNSTKRRQHFTLNIAISL